MDISAAAAPRSDQQNYDDVAHEPRTVTISGVREGTQEQPVEIHLVEYPGRPYKPNKTMIRVLILAWGKESSVYTGRRLTLVGDPTVRFGPDVVGGIKIAAMSNIDKPLTWKLTATRGRRAPHTVQPLPDAPAAKAEKTLNQKITELVAAFDKLGVTVAQLEAKVGVTRDDWNTDELAQLTTIGKAIRANETSAADEFGGAV